MNHQGLSAHAKKHYPNVRVCNLDKLDNRYIFICNSMLIDFNKLASERDEIIYIEELEVEESGVPIFSITSPFEVDLDLLTAYDLLYLTAYFHSESVYMLNDEDLKIIQEIETESPTVLSELRAVLKEDEVIVKWLRQPKAPLGGRVPLVVLKYNPKAVSDMLHRIMTGDMS